MQTVLVTELEFAKAEQVFRGVSGVRCEAAPADENALAALVAQRGVRAVIVGVAPYRGPLYAALGKQGKGLIARFGVGHDSVDKAQAAQHGLLVTNTPGALDVSVAEHALWLMGSLARRVAQVDARFRGGRFAGEVGCELRGKTLGVLGCGAIGSRVAAIAHFGFGMKVVACDQRPQAEVAAVLAASGVETYTQSAEEMFRQADIVSVHLPAVASTRRYINAARLAWLKPGAFLINTARGSVLDEADLYDALAAGKLGGAGLDVFEQEPYVPAQPEKDLRKLENVVLTPHVGSNTREANRRMAEIALTNVGHFFNDRTDKLNVVKPA